MAGYSLRKWRDPCLRIICRRVEDFSGLDELLSAMHSVMAAHSSEGVAAPQVGDNRQVLIAKINGQPQVFVNPEIIGAEGYFPFMEGCLSLPWMGLPTLRRDWIQVSYQDRYGNQKTGEFGGMNSIILQHEIDHIKGKLIYFK